MLEIIDPVLLSRALVWLSCGFCIAAVYIKSPPVTHAAAFLSFGASTVLLSI